MGRFDDNGYDQSNYGDDDDSSESGGDNEEVDQNNSSGSNNKDDAASKTSSDISMDFKTKDFDEKSSINSNLSSNNYVDSSSASVFEKITLSSLKVNTSNTSTGNQLKPIMLNTSSSTSYSSSSSTCADLKSIQLSLKKPISSSQPRKNRAICSLSSSASYSSASSSSNNSPVPPLNLNYHHHQNHQQLLLQTAPQTLVILN